MSGTISAKKKLLQTMLLCTLLPSLLLASRANHSALWGQNGESWDPAGRLPDFSYAGYHRGEDAIPEVKAVTSVLDFGAVPDDGQDDTAAFLDAINATNRGAIEIPAGRFIINDILYIRKPNIVLRGAGADLTELYFPRWLNDIKPNWGHTTSGRPTSNYSWSGGYLWLTGSYQTKDLAKVTQPAQRGDKSLIIHSWSRLAAGQRVEIYQKDNTDQTLANYLYGGDPGSTTKLGSSTKASMVVTLTDIRGNTIHFDRALRFDIYLDWNPKIRRFDPTVAESGIENLALTFDPVPYEGHFTELGHNGVALGKVANCWVRNLRIVNADSGLFVNSKFCTIDNIVFESERAPTKNCVGHHGIYFSDDDNLFTNFDYQCRFIHDISVSHCAGNVIADGQGIDICFDHHKRCPYANCFTHIDIGKGTRPWTSGGGADLGKHCAAWETFWGIRSHPPIPLPKNSYAPDLINLVGLSVTEGQRTITRDLWLEQIPPQDLQPPNIHQAQLQKRLTSIPSLGRRGR